PFAPTTKFKGLHDLSCRPFVFPRSATDRAPAARLSAPANNRPSFVDFPFVPPAQECCHGGQRHRTPPVLRIPRRALLRSRSARRRSWHAVSPADYDHWAQ